MTEHSPSAPLDYRARSDGPVPGQPDLPTRRAIAFVLAGGRGTRLRQLTDRRAKPAVPFAGNLKIIDFALSNCVNSGIRRIAVLTQYKAQSLIRHVTRGWGFLDASMGEFVDVVPAQQRVDTGWYSGTANAVYQNMDMLRMADPRRVLILAGDHIYKMDYGAMLAEHVARGAEVSVACLDVPIEDACGFGVMRIDGQHRIIDFQEKPAEPAALPGRPGRALASMGIYLFNTPVLLNVLEGDGVDFGKNIIPAAINKHAVYRYLFEGYWRDIGTVRAFWEANMELAEPVPEFNLYDADAPIYTHMRYLPASKINCCDLNRALLSEGCIISGHRILGSIIGVRAKVGEGTVIERTVMMGADYYDPDDLPAGRIPMGVGRDCFIRNAIIDKNARIGDGCYITPDGKPDGTATDLYTVQEGVIVIPKNAVVPHGTRI